MNMANLSTDTSADQYSGAGDVAPVLSVQGLCTEFAFRSGSVTVVNDLSYNVYPGETLAIVGESGSGKSISALSVMGLVPSPPGRVSAGRIVFEGRDLLSLRERDMQKLRGNKISMIFQEPMTSLNPVLSIGRQMTEALVEHRKISQEEARKRALAMLERVHIPAPEARLDEYPHQLSGGMLQRVMIAMALSCDPALLIADEPTTALDVTIQAQILDILRALQDQFDMTIVLITHDMGVVAEMADRVVILYAGRKVEEGSAEAIFAYPCQPYTKGLLGALPKLGEAGPVGSKDLNEIPGVVPPLWSLPRGCAFAPRCGYATEQCQAERPGLEEKRTGQWAACWHSERLAQELVDE